MKRILFATTALIACASLSAPAHAELDVTIGGDVSVQAAWFDNDNTNSSHRDFQSESEINVNADGKADNGLEYGAFIQLESSTSDTANAGQVALYLSGNWGKVELGDAYGVGSMAVSAPTVGIGQINGSYDDFMPTADQGHAVNDRGDARFLATDSEVATKASYYSPKVWGLQAGVSYVPEVDNASSGEAVQFSKASGNHRDMFELALTYEREFNDITFNASANYNTAEAKTGSGVEDINDWGLGAKVAYKGFSFGGGYADDGDSGNTVGLANDKVTTWNVGATYESGAWGVGVSYLAMDFGTNGDASTLRGTDGNGGEYNAVVVGAGYEVVEGLSVGADLAFYDRNRATGTDTDGTVLMTNVTAAF